MFLPGPRYALTASIESRRSVAGATGRPTYSAQSRNPVWESNETPFAAPN